MKKLSVAALILAGFALAGGSCDRTSENSAGPKVATAAPNPAMNAPDQVAWQLFAQVVGTSDGAPLFQSWASDTDTFAPNAVWPTGAEAKDGLDVHPAVLPTLQAKGVLRAAAPGGRPAHGGAAPPASAESPAAAPAGNSQAAAPAAAALSGINAEPGSIKGGPLEEVRRNQPAFDYIVNNKLNSMSGLKAAFGKTTTFPIDSMEVKTNWIPVSAIPTYYPTMTSPEMIAQNFYVANDVTGTPQALLAMHVISKQVPNWTWATFEHQLNPGRCDWIGCRDSFGATTAFVPPVDNQGQNPGTSYPACAKTEGAQALLSAANAAAVFSNYCLKGSQTDFTDNSGLAIRLGNSVIEFNFVNTASCMGCHGTAAWTNAGASVPDNAPIGPIPVSTFWNVTIPPSGTNYPYQGQPGLQRIATGADFVWSIPFCAYDDVTNPQQPAPSSCAAGGR